MIHIIIIILLLLLCFGGCVHNPEAICLRTHTPIKTIKIDSRADKEQWDDHYIVECEAK